MDFYIKGEEDNLYYDSVLQISDPIATVLQKIEVVLFTNIGEVLGATEMGCSLETLLFELEYSPADVENHIIEQFNTYVDPEKRYKIEVSVTIDEDASTAIMYIDVLVNNKFRIKVKI